MKILDWLKKFFVRKPKTIIELIPWQHNVMRLQHAECVEYIKNLPKNSVLALEINLEAYSFFSRVISILSGHTIKGDITQKERMEAMATAEIVHNFLTSPDEALPEKSEYLIKELSAAMEVINECRKRNINIEPIAAHLYVKSYSEALNEKDLAKLVYTDTLFENALAENLYSLSAKYSGKKIFALCGIAHVGEVYQILREKRISSKIQTFIFSNPGEIRRTIDKYTNLKNAVYEGNQKKAVKLYYETLEVLKETRHGSLAEIIRGIVRKLQERRLAQKQRQQRKMIEKRKRLMKKPRK